MQLSVSNVGILTADNKRELTSVSSLVVKGRLLLTTGRRLLLTTSLGASLGAGLRAGLKADLKADLGAALATGFGWLI